MMAKFRSWRWIPIIGLVLWLASTCVWKVERSEQGVVVRFGRVARVVPAGIALTLPWPAEVLHPVSTSEVRTLSVGFEDDAARLGENRAHWLTADTNIVELRFQVQYLVSDPAAWLFGVAAPSGEEKDELVRRLADSALTDLVVRTPIDEVLSVGKAALQRDARSLIQDRADDLDLGLSIVAINIAEAAPPASVRSFFIDVSSAEADHQRMLAEADGFRRELIPRERGNAHRLLQQARAAELEATNTARGAADSFLALAREVQEHPEISKRRLWRETVREALSRAGLVVYSADESGYRLKLLD